MLLERLRHESRPHHVRLEEVVGLPASLAAHHARIRAFFGFVQPWEKTLRASPHASLLAGRERTPWLLADLRHAGLDEADIAALPRCDDADLPSVSSLPAILGALYVFEGSSLGGQIISRHLETALGLRDGEGYRYFRGHGAETPARWLAFRTLLAAHSTPASDDQIVAAAQDTFTRLRRWLAPQPAAA